MFIFVVAFCVPASVLNVKIRESKGARAKEVFNTNLKLKTLIWIRSKYDPNA